MGAWLQRVRTRRRHDASPQPSSRRLLAPHLPQENPAGKLEGGVSVMSATQSAALWRQRRRKPTRSYESADASSESSDPDESMGCPSSSTASGAGEAGLSPGERASRAASAPARFKVQDKEKGTWHGLGARNACLGPAKGRSQPATCPHKATRKTGPQPSSRHLAAPARQDNPAT